MRRIRDKALLLLKGCIQSRQQRALPNTVAVLDPLALPLLPVGRDA